LRLLPPKDWFGDIAGCLIDVRGGADDRRELVQLPTLPIEWFGDIAGCPIDVRGGAGDRRELVQLPTLHQSFGGIAGCLKWRREGLARQATSVAQAGRKKHGTASILCD
jgi:hypothetical protein